MATLRFNSAGTSEINRSNLNRDAFFSDILKEALGDKYESAWYKCFEEFGVRSDRFHAIVEAINAKHYRPKPGLPPILIDPDQHAEEAPTRGAAAIAKSAHVSEKTRTDWAADLPYRRNHFFSGRREELTRLYKLSRSPASPLIAVVGLGGVGKTQLAVEFCFRRGGGFSHVLWCSADSERALAAGYFDLASKLKLPVHYSDPNAAVDVLRRWMASATGWLLVLDNADHPKILYRFLPTTMGGHVVLTSRSKAFDSIGPVEPIELNNFTVEDRWEFWCKRLGKIEWTRAARASAFELADRLHGFALALEQAAAYIIDKSISFERYLAHFNKVGVRFLDESKPQVGNYPATLATTWQINFDEAAAESPASAELLRLIAFMRTPQDAELPVPFTYLTDSLDAIDSETAPHLARLLREADDKVLALSAILAPLARFSLVKVDRPEESFTIHPLVIEVVRDHGL